MPNQVVLFVSEEKIKSFTSVNSNVSPDNLVPFIIDAQNIYLQEVLGSQFYADLKEEIADTNISDINKTLIDEFISPFVLNAALYQAIPFNYIRFREKGLLKGTSEESSPADLKDVQFLRDIVRTNMEFYRERLRRQLTVFGYLYPAYISASLTQNMNPNKRKDYSRGMSIPRRGSKTMNQQYGLPLYYQGDDIYGNDPYGCDDCGSERYGAENPKTP